MKGKLYLSHHSAAEQDEDFGMSGAGCQRRYFDSFVELTVSLNYYGGLGMTEHGLSDQEVIEVQEAIPYTKNRIIYKTTGGRIEFCVANHKIKWLRVIKTQKLYYTFEEILTAEALPPGTRTELLDYKKSLENIQKYLNISNEMLIELSELSSQVQDNNNLDFNLEQELSRIIGLDEVKNFIRGLQAQLRVQIERKKIGLKSNNQTLHMIFKGNPGTGKTTVARIVAKLLKQMGITSRDIVIETDRSGLVAGYVGQTALKTTQTIESAMNGILFIDEAYSLHNGSGDEYGKEAIDTLVKYLEDYRDKFIVILAGYSKDMDDFLKVNPGLSSRFPNIIEFPDYSVDELILITEQMVEINEYQMTDDALIILRKIYNKEMQKSHFGNAREVRNLFEKASRNQAMRLNNAKHFDKEALITIEAQDIPNLV